MSYKVTLSTEKCLGYRACEKVASSAFRVGDDNVVTLAEPINEPDDVLLKAARSCPYKVITVVDRESGDQLHPRSRK
jgi:ferredoxin